MDEWTAPAHRRQVRRVAAAGGVVWVLVVAFVALAPAAVAPRINVRWSPTVTEAERARLEQRYRLEAGEPREGTTWSYDLVVPSPANVAAVVSDAAVEDTLGIDRASGTVEASAPRGTLPVAGVSAVARWRESPVVEWMGRLALATALVSGGWLMAARRGR